MYNIKLLSHHSAHVDNHLLCENQKTISKFSSGKKLFKNVTLQIFYFIPFCQKTENFKPLGSLCTWAGRFESYQVGNPEDRFSRDQAHLDYWGEGTFYIITFCVHKSFGTQFEWY